MQWEHDTKMQLKEEYNIFIQILYVENKKITQKYFFTC